MELEEYINAILDNSKKVTNIEFVRVEVPIFKIINYKHFRIFYDYNFYDQKSVGGDGVRDLIYLIFNNSFDDAVQFAKYNSIVYDRFSHEFKRAYSKYSPILKSIAGTEHEYDLEDYITKFPQAYDRIITEYASYYIHKLKQLVEDRLFNEIRRGSLEFLNGKYYGDIPTIKIIGYEGVNKKDIKYLNLFLNEEDRDRILFGCPNNDSRFMQSFDILNLTYPFDFDSFRDRLGSLVK